MTERKAEMFFVVYKVMMVACDGKMYSSLNLEWFIRKL